MEKLGSQAIRVSYDPVRAAGGQVTSKIPENVPFVPGTPVLLKTVRARDIFVKELGKVRDEMGFHLLGDVVMPEHVHLLMSEPKQGTPSKVLQKLKLRVAWKLRKRGKPVGARQMRLLFAEMGEPPRAFWQARFYDFNVYSKGKKMEKLNYMHANPVIRGLVKHPRDWAWSSWGFYCGGGAGFVGIDVEV